MLLTNMNRANYVYEESLIYLIGYPEERFIKS